MDIYLIRHGIAGERDPEQWPDDSLRPLTSKGKKRFRRAARGLVRLVPEVDALLTSPLVRARQTAEALTKAGWPVPEICDELAQGDAGALVRALLAYRELDSIALVGHEPYLSRFAAAALGGSAPWTEMKKGSAACLRLASLGLTAKAELRFYAPPALLRAIR